MAIEATYHEFKDDGWVDEEISKCIWGFIEEQASRHPASRHL